MKKILIIATLALFSSVQAAAVEQWVEGTHYKILNEEATKKPEIQEFFSFWCPHCLSFEPLVGQIKSKMGKDVAFKKVHVNFMRMASPEIQDLATRAMMIARVVKKEDTLNAAIFNYIQKQRSPVTSINDFRNLFVVSGVDGDKFDKLAKGFGVNSLVKKNEKAVSKNRRYVNGVPNFIVNGKYQAIFDKDRSMTSDDIVDLVVWLTTLK